MHRSTRFKRLSLFGLASVALTALTLSACAPGGPDATPEPTNGGVLTVAGPYPTETLDPHATGGAGTNVIAVQIYSRLVKASSDGELVPDLATEWSANDDASEWTFTLRDDAEYSDGTPVTSAEVAASFNRFLSLKGPLAGAFTNVAIATPDDLTVVFTPPAPDPALAGKLVSFFVTKGDATDASFTEPVGSGPFMVESFTPGTEVNLVPNPSFYGDQARVDELDFTVIPEIAARLTALQTGEVQLTWGVPDDQLAQLEASADVRFDTVKSVNTVTMWMNSSRAAFESAEVRNALWQAVDFETIVSTLYPETGTLADSIVSPLVFGYSSQEAKGYDPEAATAALEEAGFDFSQTLQIQYSGAEYRQFVAAVASDLAKIGVNVEPTEKENAVFLEDLLALNWDINFQVVGAPSFDSALQTGRLYTCAAGRTGYCNPDLDAILAEAGSTSDRDLRAELYDQANQIIWDDAVGMYPMFPGIAYAWQADVQGLVLDPAGYPELASVTVQ